MEFISSGLDIIKKAVVKVAKTVYEGSTTVPVTILPLSRTHPLERIVVDREDGYV